MKAEPQVADKDQSVPALAPARCYAARVLIATGISVVLILFLADDLALAMAAFFGAVGTCAWYFALTSITDP